MAFKDPRKGNADLPLELPIGGVVYLIPPLSADVGPTAQHVIDAMLNAGRAQVKGEEYDPDDEVLDDITERDLYLRVLGKAYEQMADDDVTWPEVKRAAIAAMAYGCYGPELAEFIWNGDDEGKAPNRADRRAATGTAPARRTSPASSARTTSRPQPEDHKAPRSRGARSSTSGTS